MNDDYKDRNGSDRHENAGQGEGHRQVGNQQPDGGQRYRDDATMPNEPGGPGNERNQGQGNPAGGNSRGQGSGQENHGNDE